VPACVAVAGDRILLGDLAALLPAAAVVEPERPVGFSPRPGVRRTLLLREWAGSARPPLPGEPDEICVERASRLLTASEIEQSLTAAFGDLVRGLAIDVQDFPKAPVPLGRLVFPLPNLRLARPDPHTGLVQIIGFAEYGSDPARPLRFPIWVRARIDAETSQTELTCPLVSGEEVTPACVRETTTRLYPFLPEAGGVAIADLAGRPARRRLQPGTLVRDIMFAPRQDVKPRQEIRLTVRCGKASLRLKATTEQGGAIGEWISVRPGDSNRRLRVRIIAPGAAEFEVPANATPETLIKGT
jgi:flagella basal body P-ring formation protein FlgA